MKGKTVELPTTFNVKSTKEEFPQKQGREKSPAYLALAEILAGVPDDQPKMVHIKGQAEQEAVARHLRRAAQETGRGLRVHISENGVMFQAQKKRERRQTAS